jgi:hypothetical protein
MQAISPDFMRVFSPTLWKTGMNSGSSTLSLRSTPLEGAFFLFSATCSLVMRLGTQAGLAATRNKEGLAPVPNAAL